jgi:hypothetical protein
VQGYTLIAKGYAITGLVLMPADELTHLCCAEIRLLMANIIHGLELSYQCPEVRNQTHTVMVRNAE